MIPSLENIPILAHVIEDGSEFGGHDKKMVKKGSSIEITYQGHAYGVVPSDHNARFEFRFGEDGIEREYLVCDVLLWNKFDYFIDIISKNGGFKSQSMELETSSVKGHRDNNQVFVFEEARFEGLCLLGDNVTPAMISSSLELFSFAQNEDFKQMMEEFNGIYDDFKKGEFALTEQEEKDSVVVTPQEDETVVETPAEPTEESTQGENGEGDVVVTEEENPADGGENGESEDAEFSKTDETVVDKFSVDFELSHDDIRVGLYEALRENETFKEHWCYITNVFDNHFLVDAEEKESDEYKTKLFKVNYVKHENAVSLGEFVEVFKMIVTAEEQAKINAERLEIESMKAKIVELQGFKDGVEFEEKLEKLNTYSHLLETEAFESIKNGLNDFSMDDVEKEIAVLLLRKQAEFSVENPTQESNRVKALNDTGSDAPFGSLSQYFYK